MSSIYNPKRSTLPDKFKAGFIEEMDGRTDLKKRLSATFNGVAGDAGGVVSLPYARLCLCERFAFLEEFLRQMELKLVEDPVANADLLGKWVQAVNSMNGLAKTIGMPRSRAGGPQDWIDSLYENEDPEDTAENAPRTPSKPRKSKAP